MHIYITFIMCSNSLKKCTFIFQQDNEDRMQDKNRLCCIASVVAERGNNQILSIQVEIKWIQNKCKSMSA